MTEKTGLTEEAQTVLLGRSILKEKTLKQNSTNAELELVNNYIKTRANKPQDYNDDVVIF